MTLILLYLLCQMSTTKLDEDFMKIPWLNVTGTNWVIYKDHFLWAIDMRGHLNHIDSSMEEPVDPNLRHEDKMKALMTAEAAVELEWKKELKVWKQEEAIIKQQIATMIPDSLFMKILLKYRKVTRPGIEPRTFWTYTRCSNQLSYLALEINQLILYLCNCQSKDTYSVRHIQCHSLHARSTL